MIFLFFWFWFLAGGGISELLWKLPSSFFFLTLTSLHGIRTNVKSDKGLPSCGKQNLTELPASPGNNLCKLWKRNIFVPRHLFLLIVNGQGKIDIKSDGKELVFAHNLLDYCSLEYKVWNKIRSMYIESWVTLCYMALFLREKNAGISLNSSNRLVTG